MALKKREPDRYGEHLRRLPSARLFINDVEDVCNMLAAEAGEVTITAGEVTADTPVDLAEHSSKDRRRVTLVSTEPVIKVHWPWQT